MNRRREMKIFSFKTKRGYPWYTIDIHGRDISTMDGEDIIRKRLLGEDIIQKRFLGEDIIKKMTSWRRHHPKNGFLEKTLSKKRLLG